MLELPRPTPTLISAYLDKWELLRNYPLQERSLNLLFRELCPENRIIEHVLLKVSALNDFYSTNIFDTFSVAQHIRDTDIDARLREGDHSLVNKISLVSMKGRDIKFYSFASKYCSHHRPDCYPIFDSFIEKMLMKYKRTDQFESFRKLDLRDFPQFIQIMKGFREYYGLGDFSLKEIDIFLWMAGKEWFPKKYRNMLGT